MSLFLRIPINIYGVSIYPPIIKSRAAERFYISFSISDPHPTLRQSFRIFNASIRNSSAACSPYLWYLQRSFRLPTCRCSFVNIPLKSSPLNNISKSLKFARICLCSTITTAALQVNGYAGSCLSIAFNSRVHINVSSQVHWATKLVTCGVWYS